MLQIDDNDTALIEAMRFQKGDELKSATRTVSLRLTGNEDVIDSGG